MKKSRIRVGAALSWRGQPRAPAARTRSSSSDLEFVWRQWSTWFFRGLKISGGAGSLVALLYFVRIQSVPLDGPSSLLGLASATALVGILFMASLIVLWGVPSIVFLASVRLDKHDALVSWFRQRSQNGTTLPNSVALGPTLLWTAIVIGLPWVVLFLWALSPIFDFAQSGHLAAWASWLFWLFGIFWFARTRHVPPEALGDACGASVRDRWAGGGTRLSYAVLVSACSLISLSPLLTVADLSSYGSAQDGLSVGIFLALSVAFGVATNFFSVAFAVREKVRPMMSMISLLATVVFVSLALGLTWLGVWKPIHNGIMAAVSVRIPNAVLVIGKAGCHSLEIYGIKAPLLTLADSSGDEVCALSGVTVLSRVGARWPIQCGDEEEEKQPAGKRKHRSYRPLLRAEDVISVLPNTPASALPSLASFPLITPCVSQPNAGFALPPNTKPSQTQ